MDRVTDLAVLVPVLRRPHRVKPVLEAFTSTAPGCHVYFIPNVDDRAEHDAIRAAGGDILYLCDGGYAEKINRAVPITDEPLLLLAADDLDPQPGWLRAAVRRMGGGAQVVGLNDDIERPARPQHATHFLMTRDYAEQSDVDGGRGPLHEGYRHWYIDDELIATAKHRDAYAYAVDAHITHLHPMVGKAPSDDVYEAGSAHWRADRRRWRSRRTWQFEA